MRTLKDELITLNALGLLRGNFRITFLDGYILEYINFKVFYKFAYPYFNIHVNKIDFYKDCVTFYLDSVYD